MLMAEKAEVLSISENLGTWDEVEVARENEIMQIAYVSELLVDEHAHHHM